MDREKNYTASTSICTVLLIIFITLKLCNLITWSWLWVLAPLWIPVALVLVIYFGFLIATVVIDKFS